MAAKGQVTVVGKNPPCPHCGHEITHKQGVASANQRYQCVECNKYFSENPKFPNTNPHCPDCGSETWKNGWTRDKLYRKYRCKNQEACGRGFVDKLD